MVTLAVWVMGSSARRRYTKHDTVVADHGGGEIPYEHGQGRLR